MIAGIAGAEWRGHDIAGDIDRRAHHAGAGADHGATGRYNRAAAKIKPQRGDSGDDEKLPHLASPFDRGTFSHPMAQVNTNFGVRMAGFQTLFATRLYQARLSPARNRVLEKTCLGLAAEDKAGHRWARAHGYGGYTSYASLNDLTRRASVLAELEHDIARHVALFVRDAQFDLSGHRLALDSLWVNVMDKGAVHALHIHPHSVVSGTYYVTVPTHAGAIRFEDPRLPMQMAAPARKTNARLENRTFVTVQPRPGMLLLWESWLRHGVEPNSARRPRISISFNYA